MFGYSLVLGMGYKYVIFQCPFCGRRFKVPSCDVERLAASGGIDCKWCSRHLEKVIEDYYG
jgi:transcription elongation factor Elf1